MTVTVQKARKVVDVVGTPVASFTHVFLLENVTHLQVFADEVEVVLGVDYSVSGVGDPDGYTVTISDPGGWPDVSRWVALVNYPVNQPSDVSQGGQFGARFEAALDRIARGMQSLADGVQRAAKVSVTTATDADIEIEQAEANSVIGWNATGTGFENKGSVPQIQDIAGHVAQIVAVSGHLNELDDVAGDLSSVVTVAGSIGNVNAVGGSIGNVNAVAANETNINTVAADIADVNTVAAGIADVSAVAANATNINTVAAASGAVTTVAADIADVQTAAANMAAIQAAPGAASDAEDARDFAYLWSNEAEDVAVNDGVHTGYSTWHWYQKVLAIASSIGAAIAGAFHAADGKTTPVDADELGLADSADGWSLKKLTWANAKTALSSVFLPLTGGTMTGPLVLPASTTAATSLHIPPGVDPTAPANGDVWADSGGLRLRRSGTTAFLWDSSSLSLVSKADAEAGTSATGRIWSAERVAQAIAALAPSPPQWTELAPVATTSGSAVDWTSIPAGVTDIELWLDKVSASASHFPLLQLGTGGSPTTIGYEGYGANMNSGALTNFYTAGIQISQAIGASDFVSHCVRLHRTAGNRWLSFGSGLYTNGSSQALLSFSSGFVTLAGTLDMVRLSTSAGTFDAGSAQLRYR